MNKLLVNSVYVLMSAAAFSVLARAWRIPLAFAAGVLLCGLLLFVVLHRHTLYRAWRRIRWGWGLFALIGVFYFSPYTKISTETGPAEKSFSIHYHFAGLVSIWEVLLAAALLWMVLRKIYRGEVNVELGPMSGLFLGGLLLALAFATGLLHSAAGPLRYGITGTKRPLIAFTAPVYMLSFYVLVLNTVRGRNHVLQLIRFLKWLTAGLLLVGTGRLLLMLTGRSDGLWFFGLPVVLYDQLLMLYVPLVTLLILTLRGRKLGALHGFGALLMLFFILVSTRRFNYLLLSGSAGLAVALAFRLRMVHRRIALPRLARQLVLGAAAMLGLYFIAPNFVQGVGTSLRSLDVWSRLGRAQSGQMRLSEVKNLFANMRTRPYTYITGFGLGTQWYAIERQPVDPLTRKLRQKQNWYTQFHLPYISTLYRLGLGGGLVFLAWIGGYVWAQLRRLRNLPSPLQPVALAMVVFLILILPALVDSFNPTQWVLCGLYAGLLEKCTQHFA